MSFEDQLRAIAALDEQIAALTAQRKTLVDAAKDQWASTLIEQRHPAFISKTIVNYETKAVLKKVQAMGLPYVRPELDKAAFNKAVLEGRIVDDTLLNEIEVTYEVAFAPHWGLKI